MVPPYFLKLGKLIEFRTVFDFNHCALSRSVGRIFICPLAFTLQSYQTNG